MIIGFDKVYERDIDLYVIANFCNYSSLLLLFLKRINKSGYKVYSVESSLTDNNGESDITIVLEKNNKKIGLLVEDKIDAIAMPNQCWRYDRRGKKGIRDGKYDEFYAFIIAPKDYLETNTEAQKYPYRISYEELLEVVEDEYGKSLFKNAIEKKKKGYVVIEDKQATRFWTDYFEFIEKNKYDIDVYKTKGPRGSKSGWLHIRTFDKRVYIMHKSDRGYVDLTFNGMGEHYRNFYNYIKPLLLDNMTIQRTGKSMAIRMEVPCLDWHKSVDHYEREMREIMETIIYLKEFLYEKINIDDLYNRIAYSK